MVVRRKGRTDAIRYRAWKMRSGGNFRLFSFVSHIHVLRPSFKRELGAAKAR